MNTEKVLKSVPAQDGAGVNINRIAGSQLHAVLDPFLMVDEIHSASSDDYMAGFPSHPHRGFETITYLLQGRMRHQDHMGHDSVMESGGVQWMTAGRGVVHSEMPEASDGLFHGFQVWLNLPADQKMTQPKYSERSALEISQRRVGDVTAKMISGALMIDDVIVRADAEGSNARAVVADLRGQPGAQTTLEVPAGHKLLVYVFEGGVDGIDRGSMLVGPEGKVRLTAGERGFGALVLAAKPLNEPVVQYGPFVMNTREQIEQALQDFSSGRLVMEDPADG